MGISIRPDKLLLLFFDNKKERKLRIAEYLEEIAQEATNIAEIWDKVLTALSSNSKLDSGSRIKLDKLLGRPEGCRMINGMPVSRLQSFYESASSVLGSENRDDLEYILFRISYILKERGFTVGMVQKELSTIKKAKYFDDKNKTSNTLSIADSIDIMYKEAASLYVFAKEYKANIKTEYNYVYEFLTSTTLVMLVADQPPIHHARHFFMKRLRGL